jgi:hypothetical protein
MNKSRSGFCSAVDRGKIGIEFLVSINREFESVCSVSDWETLFGN